MNHICWCSIRHGPTCILLWYTYYGSSLNKIHSSKFKPGTMPTPWSLESPNWLDPLVCAARMGLSATTTKKHCSKCDSAVENCIATSLLKASARGWNFHSLLYLNLTQLTFHVLHKSVYLSIRGSYGTILEQSCLPLKRQHNLVQIRFYQMFGK